MTQQRPQGFGRYEVLERISAGGMAEVFKARDTKRGVIVALKKLLPQVAEDEEFIEMFEDEARIVSELEHPHIARNLDYGREDGTYFIAFEYVNGKDLRRVYEHAVKANESPPLSFLLYVIARIGEGLAYAHARKDKLSNLVHRDVSPQNIVISFDGDVKLIDFGIAKAAGKLGRTRVGTIKGKFGYMSPEQVRGDEVTQQTDVFSLGICLWELLTLKRLFHAENELLVLEKIRTMNVAPPSTQNPAIPAELDRIVMKALANSLDERYRSAKEFYRDLNVLAQSIDAVATRGDIATYMRRVFLEASGSMASPISQAGTKPPSSVRGGGVQEIPTMAADNKGSDLDIFEGLAKKTSQPAPSGARPAAPPAARPPGPPGDPGKKTLLGIAAPAVPPPVVPPPRTSQLPAPSAPAARPTPPPAASTKPAPYGAAPSAGAMDMDWDDDDEATHIFDKESERPSEGSRPAAPPPAAGAPAIAKPPTSSAPPPPPRISASPPVPPGMRAPVPPATSPGGFGGPPPSINKPPPPPSNALPPPTIDPGPPPNPFGMTMPLGQQHTAPLQMPPQMGSPQMPPPPPPGMPGSNMPPPPPGMAMQPQMPPPPPANVPMAFQQQMQPPMHHAQAGTMPPQQIPMQHEMRRMEATALVRPPSSKAPIFIVVALLFVLIAGGVAAFLLVPRTGRVQVAVTDSKGASVDRVDVFVDGKPQCQTAPCSVENVATGNHDVKVLAQGYEGQTKTVTVERGKDAQIAFSLTGGSKGTGIKVTGTQPGVKLLVDNTEIGALPQELKDLSAGDHKVKFVGPCGDPAKAGCTERYAPMEQSVSVAKDEMRDMGSITLKVVKGKATITLGTPGAKVNLVSGSERRDLPQFPISVDIDTSKQWTLEATKFGYTDYKQPISFEDGMAEKVFNVTLEPKGAAGFNPGPVVHNTVTTGAPPPPPPPAGGDATVTLNSVPAAKVVLDGKPLGDTPQKGVKISPGNHNALFINSDQDLKKSCPFSVAAGETKVVICKLRE